MRSHDIDYKVIGNDLQIVEITLDPSETVIAEAGAMCYMDDGISFEAKLGDGTDADSGFFGRLLNAGKRVFAGESLFMTHFTNISGSRKKVAFAAPYPGKILPVDLAAVGGELICQKDAFLCAALGTKVSIAFAKRLGTGFFGGEGFILERLCGDGLAFLHAGGTIVEKTLESGRILVDTGCLVGFTSGIDYSISLAGGLKTMLFGGEGIFLADLRGSGKVYLQSLPFSRMADRILQYAPSAGGNRKGEGSILGGLGDLLDGDR